MNKPAVLHCVSGYLPNTENWLYSLLKHQAADRYVAAHQFLPCEFYLDDVNYLRTAVPYRRPGFTGRHLSRIFRQVDSRYEAEIIRLLGGTRLDVMHSHFAHVGWQYQSLAAALNLPHVVSFYGMDYEHLPYLNPAWKKRYRDLFGNARLFVCEGSHGAGIIKNLGCPEDKVVVSRLGVETTKITFHHRIKKAGHLKLIQIASFREKKGHTYTIQAFAKALAESPDMTLTLVGNGNAASRSEIIKTIENSGASAQINLLPEIDFSRLHDFLKDYHVFIHPSCHTADKDCEGGAPIVLLDAQATGLPVISTIHCDIPDEVIDGKTGILCPERDTDSLSSAISRFSAMSQAQYSEFAVNARNHVCKHYDTHGNAELLLEHYRRISSNSKEK